MTFSCRIGGIKSVIIFCLGHENLIINYPFKLMKINFSRIIENVPNIRSIPFQLVKNTYSSAKKKRTCQVVKRKIHKSKRQTKRYWTISIKAVTFFFRFSTLKRLVTFMIDGKKFNKSTENVRKPKNVTTKFLSQNN